jgi:nucleolar protein 14
LLTPPAACSSAHFFFSIESLSKRFVPEAINFLIGVIQSLSPREVLQLCRERALHHPRRHDERLCVIDNGEAAELSVNRPDLVTLIDGNEQISAQANVDLLGLAIDLLAQFSEAYKALDGFVELYSPVLEVLNGANSDVLCPMLQVMPIVYPCLSCPEKLFRTE